MTAQTTNTAGSSFLQVLKQPLVFDGTASPVKTALFIITCLAWLMPGLLGRDPWKPDEAIAFGVIHSMLQGQGWITPMIAGTPYFDVPPFAAWVGTAFAELFTPLLPAHDSARLASAWWVVLSMWFASMAAVKLLDDRAGRICALLLIGSLGLLLRGHEISFALAPLAGTALALLGLVRLIRQPRIGGMILALGAALVALSAGLLPALLMLVVPLLLMRWVEGWQTRAHLHWLALAAGVTVMAAALWPLLLIGHGNTDWRSWGPAALGLHCVQSGGRAFDPLYFLRILPWYALPALPIAAWLWWKDRKHLRTRIELALPLVSFVVLLVGFSLTREPRDDMALPLLVPLLLAAVQGLDRLPRGLASFVDWFGMAIFLLVAGILWSGWTGALTGVPRGAARWVARQAPGYEHELSWLAFGLALLLTLIWLLAAAHTRRTNRRAIVNWTAGITLVWMLTNLLWLPVIDHVRSYRSTAGALKASLPNGFDCIAQIGLGDAQRAAFHYHAGLRFQATPDDARTDCNLLLIQGVSVREPQLTRRWILLWDGARPGDKAERFRLYWRQ